MDEHVVVMDDRHADAIRQLRTTGHIWGHWYAYTRNSKYRVCMVPGCREKEVVEAKS